MMRLLGFVTGAAGVIGAMVLMLGAPTVQEAAGVQAPSPGVAAASFDKPAGDYDVPVPVAEPVPMAASSLQAASATTADAVPETSREQEPASAVPINPEPVNDTPASAPEATDGAVTETVATLTEPASAPANDAALNTPTAEALWHPFWQPFRSQIAANGFASRLTAITDIDYRVLRLKPGAYQVAFAYADDLERNAKLAAIESATGLRVAEATP